MKIKLRPSFSMFSTKGVLGRKQYIIGLLYSFLLTAIIAFLVGLLFLGIAIGVDLDSMIFEGILSLITLVIMLGVFFPAILSLSIRRFHDLNLSGWLVITLFIPFLGWFVLLYIIFAPTKENSVYKE